MNSSSNRLMAKLLALALALSAGLILAVACGGGGKPDAAKIYRDAGKKMAALTAFHIEGNTEDGQEARPLSGEFVAPDKFQATFTGGNEQVREIQSGDTFYIKNPFPGTSSGDWFVYAEELFGPPGDAVAFIKALWTQLSGLTLVGEEDMGGVAMYHVQATISPNVLGLVETDPKPTKDNTIGVGKKDSLVHRLKYAFAEVGSTNTIDLSRFDDNAISIEVPSSPLPATDFMKQFVASASQEIQDCLRTAWGDAAFEELNAGTRLPTKDELDAVDRCGGGGGGEGETAATPQRTPLP